MSGETMVTAADALVHDLGRLRTSGLATARHLSFPSLDQAADLVIEDPGLPVTLKIERLLARAIASLDQGEYGDAATALFGVGDGMRAWPIKDRRERAALQIDRSADAFQRRYEADLIAGIAERILGLCSDQRLREARTQLERRHPAESRLAVQWVERFEAYYRLWTPIYALGADLTAYRSTLLEADRPYDREPRSLGHDDPGYTQEQQAEGYATDALYRWAWFQWHRRKFMLDHGGMWILSSAEAETKVADLIYEIEWHVTVFNERDLSWLRSTVAQSRGQELDHFESVLQNTLTGSQRLGEWLIWCRACECTWGDDIESDEANFPIAANHQAIEPHCQLHKVVAACDAYCTLIDEEWLRIADWYHIDTRYARGVQATALYHDWRKESGDNDRCPKGDRRTLF